MTHKPAKGNAKAPANTEARSRAKVEWYFDAEGNLNENGKITIQEVKATVKEHGPELQRVSQELLSVVIPQLKISERSRGQLYTYCLSLVDHAGTILDRNATAITILSLQLSNQPSFVAHRNAKKAHANNPAKVHARELWPEANKKGWSAERMYHELARKGHAVKADTVRKWVTKLRKTGTC